MNNKVGLMKETRNTSDSTRHRATGKKSSFVAIPAAGLASNLPAGLASNLPAGLASNLPAGLASNLPAGLASNLLAGLATAFLVGLAAALLTACPNPASEDPPPKVMPPTINPAGAYFETSTQVSLSGPAGASIRYSLDGSDPGAGALVYSEPLTVNRTLTVKAVAIVGADTSPIARATFVRTLDPLTAPRIDPPGGSIAAATLVSMNAVWGATIHYTVDSSPPDASSPRYIAAFAVEAATTVKAVAVRDGQTSQASTATFIWDGGPHIPAHFWGRWLGIGDSSVCYISGSSVTIDGLPFAHTAADDSAITLASGSLTISTDRVLRFTQSGSTLPYYFFQNAGADSRFTAALTDGTATDGGATARGGARALAGLGGIKVVIRNLANPSNRQELKTNSDGSLEAVDTIVGDDYSVQVPVQAGIAEAVEATLSPGFSGQILGNLAVGGSGGNPKVNLRPLDRPDLLMADDVTVYPVIVTIGNFGNRDISLNYSATAADSLAVVTGAAGSLGVLSPGDSAEVELGLRCQAWSGDADWQDTILTIHLTAPATGKTWVDALSLRFWKLRDTFTVAVRPGVKGVIVDPDGISYRLPETWTEGGLGSNTRLVRKTGAYTVAIGGGGDGTETVYSLAIATIPRWDSDSLTSTSVGEPNDRPDQASAIRYGESALQYLGAKDVDFYRFIVPVGSLDILTDTEPGLKTGALSVDITSVTDGAAVRYTRDFSVPGPDNGSLWTSGTIDVAADEGLYLWVGKELYEPLVIRVVERERFIPLPAGTFHNGSALVGVSAFSISNIEVTQAHYAAIMGTNPSHFTDQSDAAVSPVETVSWYEALVYCNKRSLAEGLEPVYSVKGSKDPAAWGAPPANGSSDIQWDAALVDETANGYRLPTEAQWEYAYRAGTTSSYFWGEMTDPAVVGDYAWYLDNWDGRTHGVALKVPNPWGLYDIAGNVGEWCWDWHAAYPAELRFDPSGPVSGSQRIGRGAIYGSQIDQLAATARGKQYPGSGYFGLRLVRKP
jgi:formylglycine-generating enzyme required for sulfatase activity